MIKATDGLFPPRDGPIEAGGYLGEIRSFAVSPVASTLPEGWLPCDGRTLSISSNSALFALIGNTYGGDGRTTFALPDLRGRVPIARTPGTNNVGDRGGSNNLQLTLNNLPAHSHQTPLQLINNNYNSSTTGFTQATGQSLPFDARQPYLVLTFFMASSISTTVPYDLLSWIRIFAMPGTFNFENYLPCEGALKDIASNIELFSRIGVSFGGDGTTTFRMPDLRGRALVGTGSAPGLSLQSLGNVFGAETTRLTLATLPAHTHGLAPFDSSGSSRTSSVGSGLQLSLAGPSIAIAPFITLTGSLFGLDTSQPAVGEMRYFATTRMTDNYASVFIPADGSALQVSDSTSSLFSQVGTIFGSSSPQTFNLPDVRGRCIVGSINDGDFGTRLGAETVVVTPSHMPAHGHLYTIF